jgi:hypothetical protein
MRKLSTCILQEELAVQREGNGKHVKEEGREVNQDYVPVFMNQKTLVRSEIFQFPHEPEAKRKHERDREKQSVGYHDSTRGM